MKIEEQSKRVFEPITLTIESKEDLVVLLAMLGGISPDIQRGLTGKDSGTIYHDLKHMAIDRGITEYKFLDIKITDSTSILKDTRNNR